MKDCALPSVSHCLVFKRCKFFGCNFGDIVMTRTCNFFPFLSFLLLLYNEVRSPTISSLSERWRQSKPFFRLSRAFLTLLIADSWISPPVRVLDARIDSNVSLSKVSVSSASLSAKLNLMSIDKTWSVVD